MQKTMVHLLKWKAQPLRHPTHPTSLRWKYLHVWVFTISTRSWMSNNHCGKKVPFTQNFTNGNHVLLDQKYYISSCLLSLWRKSISICNNDTIRDLNWQYQSVHPICILCFSAGKQPGTRGMQNVAAKK